MPPRKAVTAAKLRVQKAREERAKEEPDVEPEVELEEPKEEPAAAELSPVSMAFLRSLPEEWHEECRSWPAKTLAKCALDCAKDRKEAAERKAQWEADEAEVEEGYRLRLLERDEFDRLREQQQAAACANGCVCVCAYGGSRKRDFSAMGPPLASRSVSTFNANV